VDIGVPSDFGRAQHEMKHPPLRLEEVDSTWTLFLDRDGVINVNKDESYVFNIDEFQFTHGALEAIAGLSSVFSKIIIVTNQRGIGKGLMDEKVLARIHQYMLEEIIKHGGRIDSIYYCPVDDDRHHDRKPNPGMALEAAKMFPEIRFSKSIMVGDKMSDMKMGRNVGAFTILIQPTHSHHPELHPDVDIYADSLLNFWERLKK
jgi:histidinol-phosphate phosphatase family protein